MTNDLLPSADHALRFNGPLNNIHEAPVLGNGDLAAMVQVSQHEFRLHLGKQDVYDARCAVVAADVAIPQADLIRYGEEYGFRWPLHAREPEWDRLPPDAPKGWSSADGLRGPAPCPKPVGCIVIAHSGISSTRVETTLDIACGVARTSYHYDYGWHGAAALHIEAFVNREANTVHLHLRTEGLVGPLHLIIEKLPERLDPTIPLPAVQAVDARTAVVSQTLPGGCGVASFTWQLATRFPASTEPAEALVWQARQLLTLEPGAAAEWVVAVATDREAGARASCPRVLDLLAAGSYDAALSRQETAWAEFWSRSAIQLEDQELELAWYRNLYAHACHIPPHDRATAPGLCANVPVYDASPWHGVYTVNMNIQKMFLPAVWTNHPEWIDNYLGWLEKVTPTFEYLCRLLFGFDGIYSEHMLYPPWVPPERAHIANTNGRALCMVGWHGQPLWWRWQATRDRAFLARAYPYFKRAAQFYADYFDRFMRTDNIIYPSMNLEGPMTKGFRTNRDCFTDLTIIPQALAWAIAAAEELGLDEELRAGWQAAKARIHPLRWAWQEGKGYLASSGEEIVETTDPVCAAWTVFPAEYVDGDEADGLAAAIRDIMERHDWSTMHPQMIWIHHWWCAIPALRLGLPGAFENARAIILKEQFPAGHARTTHWINLQPDAWRCPEDNYLGVAAVTEMLLQSQGEVIRFFPAWPESLAARFRDLPARGGFLVSASRQPGAGLQATIISQAGETCRLRWREEALPAITCGGRPVACRREGKDLVFPTAKGKTYEIQA
ncbi:MAG: glycosyl hydrolase family 95 catalytic domain-containing protein [Armatimonadota bacterium]